MSNPSPEGILSAARTAVAEFTHRQGKPQPQKANIPPNFVPFLGLNFSFFVLQVVKLSPNRFDKMLKLDNLKNVSCHSESIDGAAVFHSVYIADHLVCSQLTLLIFTLFLLNSSSFQSLISSNDEKVVRTMSSKLDTLIGSVEGQEFLRAFLRLNQWY